MARLVFGLFGHDQRLRLVLEHSRVAVHQMCQRTEIFLVEQRDSDLGLETKVRNCKRINDSG